MGIRITTDEYGVRVWRSDRYGHTNYSVTIQKKKRGWRIHHRVQAGEVPWRC